MGALEGGPFSLGEHAAAPDKSAAIRTLQLLLSPSFEADIAVLLIMKSLAGTVYAISLEHAAPFGVSFGVSLWHESPFASHLCLG